MGAPARTRIRATAMIATISLERGILFSGSNGPYQMASVSSLDESSLVTEISPTCSAHREFRLKTYKY